MGEVRLSAFLEFEFNILDARSVTTSDTLVHSDGYVAPPKVNLTSIYAKSQ